MNNMSEKLEDKDMVKKEIAEFLKIRDIDGNTLLQYVVKSNKVELAKQLQIAAGHDMNEQNKYGDLSPPSAVHNNQLTEVLRGVEPRRTNLSDKYVVEMKIAKFLQIQHDKDNTLLHYVVKSDNIELAKQLIEAGCDVDARNYDNDSPLLTAIRRNQVNMVEVLLDADADFQSDDFMYHQTPLYAAASNGYPDIVQLLLEAGAYVNNRCRLNETALHVATESYDENRSDDYCRVIKILIDAGAIPNLMDRYYDTPLLNVVRHESSKGFDLLLSRGADVRTDGEFDYRILFAAIQSSNSHILTRLVELGYDVSMSSYSNKLMEFVMREGDEIDFVTDGDNALSYALDSWWRDYEDLSKTSDDHDQEIEEGKNREIYIRHMKCFDLLIKYRANLNHVTNNGETPLYIVLKNYKCMHSNFVRILLKNGSTLDFDHPSVREVFQTSKKSKFPRLLLRHAAMFEIPTCNDGPINFDLNKLNEKWQEDYVFCRNELESMKETKIEDTNVPFINILVNRDIGPYTRNERIRSAFETLSAVSKHFPIYGDLLYERFTEAMESEELVKEATDGLGYVLNWDTNTAHLVLSDILRYLDKQDLMNLAKI